MRTSFALLATTLLASCSLALPAEKRQSQSVGYLSATFQGDVPHVFFRYSEVNAPVSFTSVAGSRASLAPTLGTQGARDPYIFFAPNQGKYYVLATDLDIGKTNWGEAQTRGSRAIFIWESTDGLNWTNERLVTMMDETAGYVWAPSAIWDDQASAFAVFWSSRTYSPDDPNHDGAAVGPFLFYSHTTDFVNFSQPKQWDANFGKAVIDQEILDLGDSKFVRWYSDAGDGTGVVMDRSDDGLFGTWTRLGKPVDVVWEGPAIQQDIQDPSKFYLWEDNYGGPGYSCFQTQDIYQLPYAACDPALTPNGADSSAGARHAQIGQLSRCHC